jgi:hypothetical protein
MTFISQDCGPAIPVLCSNQLSYRVQLSSSNREFKLRYFAGGGGGNIGGFPKNPEFPLNLKIAILWGGGAFPPKWGNESIECHD